MRLTSLGYLMLCLDPGATGGGGGNASAAGSAGAGEGGAPAGTAGAAPAQDAPSTLSLTPAELDARVEARVTAALQAREAEAAQKAAVDKHWQEKVWDAHQIPEPVRPLVRQAWDALPVEEGKERPDPAEWAPAQPWFAALKPPSPEPTPASGKQRVSTASGPADKAAPQPPAQDAPPRPGAAAHTPSTPGVPSWLQRPTPTGGASGASTGPITDSRAAKRAVAAAMRREITTLPQ